ncbi:MAG TPA: hypothetical protein VHO94_04260 [Oscillospiraceae bacterium]|nr:hypothetical protein [Oscillospiraceae bacterium]
MDLNIQAIADAKIQAMHDSGEIQKRIEDDVQKTVLGAIDSALNDYTIRREIEDSISKSVSSVVKEIGFTGYNGFIAKTIKEITEGVMRDDVAQKIQKVFNDMLIVKHDGIKLSEIFQQYRKYICESAEESDKYEWRQFVCDLDVREDGSFTHYDVKFNEKPLESYESAEIEFSLCTYREKGKSNISSLLLDGNSVKGTFKLGRLSEMQSLLANLYFNETEIIIDTDDVDDSDFYDIDD